MISFVLALLALILGYIFYGRFVSRVFGVQADRPTPAYEQTDGVDFVPMPAWKVYLIQFLNIAGLGPIFGAIMGAKFGTASYLWIVLGSIFAGGVHDYLSAMISIRKRGASITEIIDEQLGKKVGKVMLVILMMLLILVGATFTSGPSELLAKMTGQWGMDAFVWIGIIFCYYVLATVCPVNKIIGKIYPVFGFCMLFMAISVMLYILIVQPELPELWSSGSFINKEWESAPIIPLMFISIACGAISGFHSTQSTLMARCVTSERVARHCFYGAMLTEGAVTLVWAAAATVFFHENGVVNPDTGNAYTGAAVANIICNSWLGTFGGVLAVVGIIVAPISTGDTSLRCARLILADFFKYDQKPLLKRFVLAVPVFVFTIVLLVWSLTDANGFGKLWRYLSWTNQLVASITLWAISVYLKKNKKLYWITFVPAVFMTFICTSYIIIAPEGLQLDYVVGMIVGAVVAVAALVWFVLNHNSEQIVSKEENN